MSKSISLLFPSPITSYTTILYVDTACALSNKNVCVWMSYAWVQVYDCICEDQLSNILQYFPEKIFQYYLIQ